MYKKIIILVAITVLLFPNIIINYDVVIADDINNWVIDNNTVYVNDSRVYASATPHTVYGNDKVIFEFESKKYDGDIDFIWGFDTSIMKPCNIWLWKNYSHFYGYEEKEQYSYYDFNNVTNYSILDINNYDDYYVFWGNKNNSYLYNISVVDNLDNNTINFTVAFSDYIKQGNNYRIFGNINRIMPVNKSFFDWKIWNIDYNHIKHNFRNMTDWYITPNINIDLNYRYKVMIELKRTNYDLNNINGKYWFAFKPSDETLLESINNNHLYYLDPWYNTNWDYRKLVTIDKDQVPSTLTDFPVLINFSSVDVKFHAQDDGDDIVFVLYSDNSTVLNHEIEYYYEGRAVIWVNVPSLSSSVDTKFYMYYGNNAVGSQEHIADTWNNGFEVVIHCNQSFSPLEDSVCNNQYTESGTPIYENTGGKGVGYYTYYGDNEDHMDTSPDSWDNDDRFISLLLKRTGEDDEGKSIDMCPFSTKDTNGRSRIDLIHNVDTPDEFNVFIRDVDNDEQTLITPELNLNQWYHISVCINCSTGFFAVYKDGVKVDSVIDVDIDDFSPNPVGVYLGDWQEFNRNWIGNIDEVRISDVVRNSSWIKTEYNTINNATSGGFFTLGFEEFKPVSTDNINYSGCTLINGSSIYPCDISNISMYIYNTAGNTFNTTIECNGDSNNYNDILNKTIFLNFTNYLFINNNYTVWINNTKNSYYWNYTLWFNTKDSFCDYIKESDIMEINIDTNLLGICLTLIIFLIAFYIDSKSRRIFWLPILLFCDVPIALAVGISFIGNPLFSVGFWIGAIMLLFAIVLSFGGLYYGLNFGRSLD